MSTQIPKTYKAQIQREKSKPFEYIDVDYKKPASGQIVIKTLACGVCHSDSIVKHEVMPVLPRIPGHEVVGTVVEVGDGVKSIKVGDYVGGGWHGYQCESCESCRRGDFVTCQNQKINGVTMDGGYAEYTTLYANATVRLPEGIDPAEAAPLLCAGVTTHNGILGVGVKAGGIVAVQGIGGLGSWLKHRFNLFPRLHLFHLLIYPAAKMGYDVVALSSSDSKKELAKSLGAKEYISGDPKAQVEGLQKLSGGRGIDLVVCTAPSPDIIGQMLPSLAVGGTILLLAVPEGPLSFNAMPMIQKRLSVKGHPSGSAFDSEVAVKFAQAFGVKCQVERYSLEDADKAFEAMSSGKARFRSVLIPGYKA